VTMMKRKLVKQVRPGGPNAPIRPIRNERDHAAALKAIEQLWDCTDGVSKDRLEVLAVLVEAYERIHHAIEAPSAVDAIQFRMDQRGMTRADLGVVIGSRSRATEIMSGIRELSIDMIRTLHRELQLPLEILVMDSAVKPARRAKRTA
jgi:HTH-type transcriptional regulator / antitoxin HigA